ncbi:MAG: hypothetical protein IT236_18945 [Bacteroidia bacterium]|nr:hypothetical protein [Bacteroidia bacterium]
MNGQEKDEEIFTGAMNAEYWEYDSRILRRWNVDPITYPWQSPYACFNNNPITYSDPSGLEGEEGEGGGDKAHDYTLANHGTKTLSDPRFPRSPVNESEPSVGQLWSMFKEGYGKIDRGVSELGKQSLAFGLGIFNAVSSNMLLGGGRGDVNTLPQEYRRSARTGQIIGDILSIVISVDEMIAGVGGEGGGMVLNATGVGAIFGAPTMAASTALIGHGLVTCGVSMRHLINDINEVNADNHNGNSGLEDSYSGGLDDGRAPEMNDLDNPVYAPTPKHQKGGWGTLMDLDDATAQEVLNNSSNLGKQKYGFHKGKIYEFQPDNVGGWHGYPINPRELIEKSGGTKVIRQWLKEGKMTKADYKKLIN